MYILYGFSSPTEFGPPLSRFQATMAEKVETKKLLSDINKWGEKPVTPEVFNKTFETMWPDFEKVLAEVSGIEIADLPAPTWTTIVPSGHPNNARRRFRAISMPAPRP